MVGPYSLVSLINGHGSQPSLDLDTFSVTVAYLLDEPDELANGRNSSSKSGHKNPVPTRVTPIYYWELSRIGNPHFQHPPLHAEEVEIQSAKLRLECNI